MTQVQSSTSPVIEGSIPDAISSVIRARRTSMLVDRERPVSREFVEELCDLAQWAPNHKRTWPWRFAYVTGDGRARLGDSIADAMAAMDAPPDKVAKTRGKYLRTPASVVVGSAPGDDPVRTAENRDAVAAGIQNLLIGATAAGLATYWGSVPESAHQAVASLCRFEPGCAILAVVYLGWPTSEVEAPARPPVTLHDVTH